MCKNSYLAIGNSKLPGAGTGEDKDKEICRWGNICAVTREC